MDKTFEKVFDAMPREYKDNFLQYNLLKRHFSLYVKGACQCSVKREFEDACSPFGDLEAAAVLCSLQCSVKRKIEEACSPFDSLQAAAVLCSFRGLPALYRPCSYCGVPEQGGPKRLDLELQISEFGSLLLKELEKINNFFNLLHRQYIGTMKELDAMWSQEVSRQNRRQNRRRSEDRKLWIHTEIELEKITQCMKTTAAKIDLLASYCTLNRTAFIEILRKHDEETGSYISGHFSNLLQNMAFVCYGRAVKRDAKSCLSLLGSSTVSSSSEAPPMSSRGKNLWLSLQQERLQSLISSDGNFDYIEAAKVAKDAIAAWSPTVDP